MAFSQKHLKLERCDVSDGLLVRYVFHFYANQTLTVINWAPFSNHFLSGPFLCGLASELLSAETLESSCHRTAWSVLLLGDIYVYASYTVLDDGCSIAAWLFPSSHLDMIFSQSGHGASKTGHAVHPRTAGVFRWIIDAGVRSREAQIKC